jgi:hypothetical protein
MATLTELHELLVRSNRHGRLRTQEEIETIAASYAKEPVEPPNHGVERSVGSEMISATARDVECRPVTAPKKLTP